ncbi:hypothetical protein [Agrococcus sp. SGAir0287]|uniref:hypothetical protein n=1 Tax=Agrococcus sp. SGAir0287 TaxID=2070347 RepID=UPI0010CCC1F6|nr:hypothetical protein [Agrococcus sp. SGAir0287]QCR19566.1 hypothetical protein C1N71_09120 [Agrococcus sp. SGAir0287]
MSDEQSANIDRPTQENGVLEQLLERAKQADIKVEVRDLPGTKERRRNTFAMVYLPNGRHERRVLAFPSSFQSLLDEHFEDFVVLGDYVAVVSKSTGAIEAALTARSPAGRNIVAHQLRRLPGIVKNGESDPEVALPLDQDDAGLSRASSLDDWSLSVSNEGVSVTLSAATKAFSTLFDPGPTVKVTGVVTSDHDTALEALERYANGFVFDLDVVYGVPVQIARKSLASRQRRQEAPEHPPAFPRNHYAAQALELYQYGRSASGLPLLEYLAYYQAIEHFFPFFAREQTVNAVRTQLLHPGFDARDDAALYKLINLAGPGGRSGPGEKEQLRATVRACVEEADLKDFIQSLPEYTDHFCSKQQSVKGIGVINIDNSNDLRDQVADRIYALRCRIVHAKQDGGGHADVLLPSSRETESLQADVELVRLVAQRALIARAARV